MNRSEYEIYELTVRLRDAEKRLKMLNEEIADIKIKIEIVQETTRNKNKRVAIEDDNCLQQGIKKERLDSLSIVDDFVIVFVDGACENNSKSKAKAGIGVWFGRNHPWNVSRPVQGKATSILAEIQSCLEAVQIAKNNNVKKLWIKTDSMFVLNAMQIWVKEWMNNNWKDSTNCKVEEKEEIIKLYVLSGQLDVRWELVRARTGLTANQEVEALANAGLMQYKIK